MKRFVKRFSKVFLAVMMVVMMLVLAGCTAVQVSASLTLKGDGTGSRTIRASIAKNDFQDGYGSAYYYLKKHGDDLEQYIAKTYKNAVPGSESWLKVTVNDSGSDWETIDLTFDFTSFEDYKEKLAAMAYDKTAAAAYVAPELTENADGTVTYTENTAALTAIFKSLQTAILADGTIFDINSTKDGKALNDGSADFQSLSDYGVELIKPEFGDAMVVDFGEGPITVAAADGAFTVTGKYAVIPVTQDAKDDTANTQASDQENASESTSDSSIPKTGENMIPIVTFVICIVACAAGLLITKKHEIKG